MVDGVAVVRLENGAETTLGEWLAESHRPVIVDFWNDRCTRCPAALSKLYAMARADPRFRYASCVLETETCSTPAQAAELVCDDDEVASPVLHLFMPFAAKEGLKVALGFSTLPFCLVCEGGTATIVWKGDPRSPEFDAVVQDRS